MRILLAGYYSAFWHEKAWVQALRELGHEVVEFPMQPYVGTGIWKKVQNRLVVGPLLRRVNNDFREVVRTTKPDVVVCYRALLLYPETIQQSQQESRSYWVCYQNDNIFGALKHRAFWRWFKRAIPYYDLHLVFRTSDVAHYKAAGAKRVYVLYHHYLPWLHRPLSAGLTASLRSDVCFLGHCEPDRRLVELDSLMRSVPADYRIHGSSWKRYSRGRAWQNMDTRELHGEEYVNGLNGAKIALSFFSSWNADGYTTRVFEIPACRTLLVSQRSDEMQRLYEEDKEAVFFDSAAELTEKVRYYLHHDSGRGQIAEAGYRRCTRSGYDIYSRMREWLREVEIGMTKGSA